MLTRRRVILTLAAGAFVPEVSFGQPSKKIPRIAFLHSGTAQSAQEWVKFLLSGMSELGYTEGKNFRLEPRWADGKLDRLPALAAELVQSQVNIIVAVTSPSVVASGQATKTIPIVMPLSSDPVGDKLVASLARPGGNITGLSVMSPELGEKRIQLLKEIVPNISRPVAVVWNPAYVGMRARFAQTQSVIPKLGLTVRSMEARDERELDAAFDAIIREGCDALVQLIDPFTRSQLTRIVDFAAKRRLVAIYESSEFVEAGGLMSYGPYLPDQFRRAAYYVDRILKGARPGDLPIEQPTKFELAVNMKTARALGITMPYSIVLQATKIIE
jgi:putative ABC transport system substrate-binding protein